MSLRKIDENITVPNLADFQAAAPKWESIQCRLVTPMYGGGVKSAEPDIQQPIRVTAIRGQLRFWWRLLASQKVFRLPENLNIRQAEFALWGGMNDGDESGKASAVLLRVSNILFEKGNTWHKQSATAPYTEYAPRMSDILNYVLFPARDTDICLLKPKFSWQLEWHIDKNAPIFWRTEKKDGKEKRIKFSDETYQELSKQVIETLRWWTTFGGMGARTRRGCGAFAVEKSTLPEIVKPISLDEIQAANCQLVTVDRNNIIKEWEQEQEKSQSKKKKSKWEKDDAMFAWEFAVKRLRDFRQGVNVGRNEPSDEAKAAGKPAGRSRWTEPDAIRRITIGEQKYRGKHIPKQNGSNQFPRGMFGMPIIFHFPPFERVNGQFVPTHEPQDTSLQPVGKERMASPVIIRPILQNGQWKAAALLLPHDFSNLKVELKIEKNDKKTVVLLDKDKANEIKPIAGNGGRDPLSAFMNYFANPTKQD